MKRECLLSEIIVMNEFEPTNLKGKTWQSVKKIKKKHVFCFFREINDFWRQPDSTFYIFQKKRKSCFATTPCRQNRDVLSKSMVFMSFCKAIRMISLCLKKIKRTEWLPQKVMDFAKKNNILIFPYSIVILRCTVVENIYKLQVRAFVYHTLFG